MRRCARSRISSARRRFIRGAEDVTTANDNKVNLLGLERPALEALVAGLGSKPFRARQLMGWLY
ncbi:MAG: hypothetical protein ACRETT_12745, partial [Steroidobacteraceae bacterium]